jgi:hypothetical protein
MAGDKASRKAMSQICVGKEAALLWERIYPRISRLKPLPQVAFADAVLATGNWDIANKKAMYPLSVA